MLTDASVRVERPHRMAIARHEGEAQFFDAFGGRCPAREASLVLEEDDESSVRGLHRHITRRHCVLHAVSVLVLVRVHRELAPTEARALESHESCDRRIAPVRNEDRERERLIRRIQDALNKTINTNKVEI